MNFLDEQVKVNPGFLDDSIIYDDPYLRSTNLDDVAILNDNETIEEAKVRIKNQASDSFKMSANSFTSFTVRFTNCSAISLIFAILINV